MSETRQNCREYAESQHFLRALKAAGRFLAVDREHAGQQDKRARL